MRTRTALVLLALLPLTACSSAEADEAACKAAMHEQYEAAVATGAQGQRPDDCKGVDDETLQRLSGEVITEQLNGKGIGTPSP
ncbi:hypothetical protein ACWGVR_14360 [Streptomyces xanthophaeus]